QEQQVRRKGVPEPVLAAFEKAYPNATVKGYSKEKDDAGQIIYEVECEEGKVKRDVTYRADGTLVSIEETVEPDEWPSAIRAAVDSKFPGGKVLKAEKIIKGDTVTYEFQIRHNGRKTEVVFDPAGNEVTS
ncbi:MAG: PepSY-like domain-containing protein, partial [Gammaproteobacteria bacterium]